MDEQTTYLEVEVRREPRLRNVLIGTVAGFAFIASLGVWGPTWPLNAAEWATTNIAAPVGDWISDQINKADEIHDTTTTTAPTP